jgi:hypothetical protein
VCQVNKLRHQQPQQHPQRDQCRRGHYGDYHSDSGCYR